LGFSLAGKDALKYAELPLLYPGLTASLPWLRAALRRTLVYGSAVILAIFLSGSIFTFTPLIGISLAHTQGVSMEPLHQEGDLVLIRRIDGAQAAIGDIVVFEGDGRSIMHRVVQRYSDEDGRLMLVTQGDNVAVADHPIPASQVSARLMAEVPYLGDASRFLHGKGGFFVYRSLVISVAVFSVALWGIVSCGKGERLPTEPLQG